jgi:hypothetical protein
LYGSSIGFFVGTAHGIARWRGTQYDSIVASTACEHFWRSREMDSMMVLLLSVGAGLLLAGLLTVGLGIQLELSFGNTLILSGTVVACTGMIMLSLWAVARELKRITLRLGSAVSMETRAGTNASRSALRNQVPEDDGFSFSRDLPELDDADDAEPPPPPLSTRREETATRDRGAPPPVPIEDAPAVKPRRNLMFSSSLRKERAVRGERAIPPRLILVPRRLLNQARYRPQHSTMPGQNRSVRGRPKPRRSAAAAARLRRPPKPTALRIVMHRPREMRIGRR